MKKCNQGGIQPYDSVKRSRWFLTFGWIGGHLLSMKNHVYPHTLKFFMGDNKKAQMQYKNWATDATRLPHRELCMILRSIPEVYHFWWDQFLDAKRYKAWSFGKDQGRFKQNDGCSTWVVEGHFLGRGVGSDILGCLLGNIKPFKANTQAAQSKGNIN